MNYLLWINIYLIIFYGFYWVFLRKTTFFQVKRFYLLFAGMLSFVLPLMPVDSTIGSENNMILAAVTIGQQMNDAVDASQSQTSTWDLIALFYSIGMGTSLCLLTVRSLAIGKSLRAMPQQRAFSFFRQIVIDPEIEGYERILAHERTHVREWHSIDVLAFEIIKIINWFNPISYLLANSVKLNHEYIADQQSVASTEDRMEYAHLLIANTLDTDTRTLANNFFNKSILKPRIAMLFKNKSKKSTLISFSLLIPLITLTIACQSSSAMSGPTTTTFIGVAAKPATDLPGKTDTTNKDTALFMAVETPPSPKGGMRDFYQYIANNYKFPKAARKNKVKGKVIVRFVVEKDGSLSNIEVTEDLQYGTGEEAVRVLQNSPKWNPGIQNGKPVRVQFTLPIQLNLAKQ